MASKLDSSRNSGAQHEPGILVQREAWLYETREVQGTTVAPLCSMERRGSSDGYWGSGVQLGGTVSAECARGLGFHPCTEGKATDLVLR